MASLVSFIKAVIMNIPILDDNHVLLSGDEICCYHCLFTCEVVYSFRVQIQVYRIITKNEFPSKSGSSQTIKNMCWEISSCSVD